MSINPNFEYFETNPINLELKDNIIKDAKPCDKNNQFIAFIPTRFNDTFIIYASNYRKNLVLYSLDDNQKIQQIKNPFSEDEIISIRYFINNNIDYIVLTSYNKIKIFIIIEEGLNEILSLSEIYNDNCCISSSCLLFNINNDENYIIIANSKSEDKIKIYDLNNGKFIRDFGDNDLITYVDSFIKDKIIYILVGTIRKGIKVYDFNDNKLYKQFNEDSYLNGGHFSIIINNNELIESSSDKYIRIWDFNSGKLIKKIDCACFIIGILTWNGKFLFVGNSYSDSPNIIKLINLEDKKIVKEFQGPQNSIYCLQKVKNKQYGECLLSICKEGYIKLWNNPNY